MAPAAPAGAELRGPELFEQNCSPDPGRRSRAQISDHFFQGGEKNLERFSRAQACARSVFRRPVSPPPCVSRVRGGAGSTQEVELYRVKM